MEEDRNFSWEEAESIKYQLYEQEKKRLAQQRLSETEYEREVERLCEWLGV